MTNVNSKLLNAALRLTSAYSESATVSDAKKTASAKAFFKAGVRASWISDAAATRKNVLTLADGTTIVQKALRDLIRDAVAKGMFKDRQLILVNLDIKAVSENEKAERAACIKSLNTQVGNVKASLQRLEEKEGLSEEEAKRKKTPDEMFIDVIARAFKLANRDEFTLGNKPQIVERLNEIIKSL